MGTKKKPYMKAALWGIVSIGIYFALYAMEGMLNDTFSKGGYYAFLPIATAFLFSVVHGNFTGNFWSVLGIEASKNIKEVK